MRTKAMSIRFRLTAWYTAVLVISLGLVSLGVYSFMRNRLESMTQNKLDAGFETVANVLRNSYGDIMDVFHLGQRQLFQVSKNDHIVYQTQAWQEEAWTEKYGDAWKETWASLKTEDGRTFHLKKGGVPEFAFELVYAFDSSSYYESIRNLRLILTAGLVFAFVLGLGGGYFLAGRALLPIKAITRKAREITAEHLSERLPVAHPEDEIGQLAGAFNATLARFEESFSRLHRFTADASHELRTPLTSIRSVGEVALRGAMDKTSCREAIGSMLEETQRLTQLTDNLLLLARGDSRETKLRLQSVDLSLLTQDVAEELHVLAEENGQTLSTSFLPNLITTLDRTMLRHAVSNVLHNAITYTPRGGDIQIETSKTEEGRAAIDIIDDGPGIPENERTRVFERFYRLDKARTRERGGAGLGLAIARWAVENNGGRIEFLNKEGRGTWCRLSFPLQP